MRIDKIEISNFRGFYERTFTFDPAMNVVVGNNTSGKTALLHAVQIALGAFFPGFDLLPKANQQYRRNFSKVDVSRPYNPA
ncbi:MAG: AAA family ATPase, partial [Bacteroidales bacterium]|nr:AAA family ATPase [Bacteroidales bacterium]